MTMKDLRGKALIWVVNQPDDWDFNNPAYANLRDYLALEKGGRIYALDGSSVPLVSQNDYECPDGMTVSQFAEQKNEKFANLLRNALEHNDSLFWCYNAANAYVSDMFPDYVTFANHGYPLFISSLNDYPRSRGVVLQDYAGQSDIKRVPAVEFLVMCSVPAVAATGVNGVVDAAKSFINYITGFFGGKKLFDKYDGHIANAAVLATYKLAEATIPFVDTHAQQLTEALVENNFPTEAAITAYDGTNTTTREGYANLFDGNSNTKWCVNSSNRVISYPSKKSIWFVDFKTTYACRAKSYTMITGNDTESYPTRNPKKWTLLGKVQDEWTVLSEVDTENGGAPLPVSNYSEKGYIISNPQNCQIYRLIVESSGETPSSYNNTVFWMQLGGLKLIY